jgi:hypothetical protein
MGLKSSNPIRVSSRIIALPLPETAARAHKSLTCSTTTRGSSASRCFNARGSHPKAQEAIIDQAFLGRALHAPERGEIETLADALIVVGADGVIGAVLEAGSDAGQKASANSTCCVKSRTSPQAS